MPRRPDPTYSGQNPARHTSSCPCLSLFGGSVLPMAKRGESRPFTVRFQFDGQREWAAGSYVTRESAELAAEQQGRRVGPSGQTCTAWVVTRR